MREVFRDRVMIKIGSCPQAVFFWVGVVVVVVESNFVSQMD